MQVFNAQKKGKQNDIRDQQRHITDALFSGDGIQVQQDGVLKSLSDIEAMGTPESRTLALSIRKRVHVYRWGVVKRNNAVRYHFLIHALVQ